MQFDSALWRKSRPWWVHWGTEGMYAKLETKLAGERIPCFLVNGEKRLVLSIFLNSVLKNFSIAQISQVCQVMNIECSRCSPIQLKTLKDSGVIPREAPNCGLINKSDAERLSDHFCPVSTPRAVFPPSEDSLHIQHHCFGRETGFYEETLYNGANDKCIICENCSLLLTPEDFIMHTHNKKKRVIRHWGLDREKWRNFIFPCEGNDPRACRVMREMKHKFMDPNDLDYGLLEDDPVRDVPETRVLSFPKCPVTPRSPGVDCALIMREMGRIINNLRRDIEAKITSVQVKNDRLRTSLSRLKDRLCRVPHVPIKQN